MKVFVAGSTGRVATELLYRLVEQGYDVIAGARNPERVIKRSKIKPVLLDLHASVSELSDILRDSDAIIFTAGSRGTDLLQTDALGAVKLMQAAASVGIKRFVMLSSLYSLEMDKWPADLLDYYAAKYFADNYLIHQTDLDYTIIQPGILLDEAGLGVISLEGEGVSQIPIPDVAAILADVINKPSTYRKVYSIYSGQKAITDSF